MNEIDREDYVALYGPTTGDLVRLADTDLWVKVEKDYTTCKHHESLLLTRLNDG